MTHRVGRKGQVVIPKAFREAVNLEPGDEVYYTIHRAAGEAEARSTLTLLRPTLTLDTVSPERVMAAARIKAVHPLAYGEAFAIATATAHKAVLLTGDPEIVGRPVGCRVEDLRRWATGSGYALRPAAAGSRGPRL